MKYVLAICFLAGAFFIEIAWGSRIALWEVRPPLFGAALIFLFWNIGLSRRLFWAILAGVLMDSVSLYVFGTYTAIFIILAFFTEILRGIFSHAESFMTRGVGTAMGTILFVNLILFFGWTADYVHGLPVPVYWEFWGHVFLASLVWAVLLPTLITFLTGALGLLFKRV